LNEVDLNDGEMRIFRGSGVPDSWSSVAESSTTCKALSTLATNCRRILRQFVAGSRRFRRQSPNSAKSPVWTGL